MKKLFEHKSDRFIWKLLISGKGKIVLEQRDLNKMQVYFSCLDYYSGKYIWKDMQFGGENYWIGIESLSEEVLILHKFFKPDLPVHKEIIAIDLNTANEIWKNMELAYYFNDKENIYAFKSGMDDEDFYCIDINSGFNKGQITKKEVDTIRENIDDYEKWKNYSFAFRVGESFDSEEDLNLIKKFTPESQYGNVEYISDENYLIFNYYDKIIESSLCNILLVIDKKKTKVVFRDIINESTPSPVPDSFFIYKDILFFIRNKTNLVAVSLK